MGLKDPAASTEVSQETWMMDVARFAGPSYYMPAG
jgi:hypothetical protein